MSSYTDKIYFEVDGASHTKEIVTHVFGVPKGVEVDLDKLQEFCDRRKSVNSSILHPVVKKMNLYLQVALTGLKG